MDITVTIPNAHAQRVVDAFGVYTISTTNESLNNVVAALGPDPTGPELEAAVVPWLTQYVKDRLTDTVINYEATEAAQVARSSSADLYS